MLVKCTLIINRVNRIKINSEDFPEIERNKREKIQSENLLDRCSDFFFAVTLKIFLDFSERVTESNNLCDFFYFFIIHYYLSHCKE